MSDVILEVKNLKKYFKTSKGMLHAVDDVSVAPLWASWASPAAVSPPWAVPSCV